MVGAGLACTKAWVGYSAPNKLGVVLHSCNRSIPEVEKQKFEAILRHTGKGQHRLPETLTWKKKRVCSIECVLWSSPKIRDSSRTVSTSSIRKLLRLYDINQMKTLTQSMPATHRVIQMCHVITSRTECGWHTFLRLLIGRKLTKEKGLHCWPSN